MSDTLRAEGKIKYLLSVDIETTGQTPITGTMIELAAALVSLESKEVVSTRYYYFGEDDVIWCARTLLEFWNELKMGKDGKTPLELLRERVERDQVPVTTRRDAALDFVTWARNIYDEEDGAVMAITDTSGFDASFISHLLAEHENAKEWAIGKSMPYSLNYLFGEYQPVRDINSFYLGAGGTLKKWGARDAMKQRFAKQIAAAGGSADGDPAPWAQKFPHDHNPLNDARKIGLWAAFYLTLDQADEESSEPSAKRKKVT